MDAKAFSGERFVAYLRVADVRNQPSACAQHESIGYSILHSQPLVGSHTPSVGSPPLSITSRSGGADPR